MRMNFCAAAAAATIALACASVPAAAATEQVTAPAGLFTNAGPSNAAQFPAYESWYASNVRSGGSVGVTNTYPHNGTGSVELNLTSNPNSKADLEYYFRPENSFLLSSLNGLSYDYYRSSTSAAAAKFDPALRLYVSDGARSGYLVYEPIYNGQAVSPVDTWVSANVTNAFIWSTGSLPDAAANYTRTAADWAALLPNLRVYGLSVGVGSGWDNSFAGAVDNVAFSTTGGVSRTFNFEAASVASPAPEPATWAMMIVGFGVVGGTLRRRRVRSSVSFA